MKFRLLLNVILIANLTKAESSFFNSVKTQSEVSPALVTPPKIVSPFLAADIVKDLRESFKPILEVPSKFLKFRALWYEGNNRQQMSNILMKEKIKRTDLQRLIELLNQEEKRLGYKASVIADAVNSVIRKKFLRELSHLMSEEQVEREAKAKFIDAEQLVSGEKSRHSYIIQEKLLPLIKTLPVIVHKK